MARGDSLRGEPVSGEEPALLADRYELLEELGRGGMAVVYKAVVRRGAGFGRLVAVKKMLPSLCADRHMIALFVEEARVCARIRHPNVVQILHFGVDDGRYFLVMEWVDGCDLLDYARAYRETGYFTPWAAIANIGIEVLKGLSAAHSLLDAQGRPSPIFHRDVTPHNILLGVDGTVKLSDFGLARASDRATMTLPHVVKGKLSYTAPELTHGAPTSAKTDIFALGVTLWETLAGRKLFEGSTPFEVIQRIQSFRIPDLDRLRPDVPKALVAIIQRSIARDPENRFASAAEMAEALHALAPPRLEKLGRTVADAKEKLRKRRPAQAAPPEESSIEVLPPRGGLVHAPVAPQRKAAPGAPSARLTFEPSSEVVLAAVDESDSAHVSVVYDPSSQRAPAAAASDPVFEIEEGELQSVKNLPVVRRVPPPAPPSSKTKEPSIEEVSAVLDPSAPHPVPPPLPSSPPGGAKRGR